MKRSVVLLPSLILVVCAVAIVAWLSLRPFSMNGTVRPAKTVTPEKHSSTYKASVDGSESNKSNAPDIQTKTTESSDAPLSLRQRYGNLSMAQIRGIQAIEEKYAALGETLKAKREQIFRKTVESHIAAGQFYLDGEFYLDPDRRMLFTRRENPSILASIENIKTLSNIKNSQIQAIFDHHQQDLGTRSPNEQPGLDKVPEDLRDTVIEVLVGQRKLLTPQGLEHLVDCLRSMNAELVRKHEILKAEIERASQSKSYAAAEEEGYSFVQQADGRVVVLSDKACAELRECESELRLHGHDLISEIREYVARTGSYRKSKPGEPKYLYGYWEGLHVACNCTRTGK